MDKKVKARWTDALRSGFYRKGTYQLRDLDDHYDPLGVLCELAVLDGVLSPPQKLDGSNAQVFYGYRYGSEGDWTATGLPTAVQEWSGLDYHLGYRVGCLSDGGKTFVEIADWIDSNL